MERPTTNSSRKTRKPGISVLYGAGAAIAAVGVVLHALFVPSGAVSDAPFLIPWWSLAAAFAVFEYAVVIVRVDRDPHTVSIADVPFVLGLLLASPAALIFGRLIGTTVGLLARRHPAPRLVFNLGMHYLETVLAVAVLRALLGETSGGILTAWVLVLGVHVLATAVSAALVMLAIRLTDRRRRTTEIARSLVTGFVVSFGTGLVSVLFLIAAWSNPWALFVVAVVTAQLYVGLRIFGSLSDRHSELKSVHSFSTSLGMQESGATLDEDILRDLAETFGVDTVEVAAHHMASDGRHWFFSRLDGETFSTVPDDEEAVVELISAVADLGVVDFTEMAPDVVSRLGTRGFGEGLVNGFRPNGLLGYIALGDPGRNGRSFRRSRPLLVTLTGPMIANLERIALVERLRTEVAIKEHQRLHDGLTGLANRLGFAESIEEAVTGRAERFAIAVVDLDHFQEVNDVFGPERGDAVLIEIAQRLREGIRADDVVARIGGDEYAVLFNEVRGTDATLALARRIGDAFLAPFSIDEASLTMSGSTGIAIYPEHGEDPDTLLRRAEMARSVAKLTRGAIEVFDMEQDLAAERRLMLASDLRPAIESGDLKAAYQPKIELATGSTIGFEALARWSHHQLGPISAGEFINLAQHSGVIAPLTFRILEMALDEVSRWRDTDPSLSVSVNVAAEVLADEDFADRVQEALKSRGLAADALILEITESQNLAEDRRTRDSVLRLAAAGVMLSIDDFGTGYSALSYLQNLPVGEVKIDRSFVTRMAEHPGDRAIVEGTIQLLHSVGLRVVAEGIETSAVWELLDVEAAAPGGGRRLGDLP